MDALKRNDPIAPVAATLRYLFEDFPKGQIVINTLQLNFEALAHTGRGSVNAALNPYGNKV